MSKRGIPLVTVTAVAAMLTAGCGSGGSTAPPSSNQATSQPTPMESRSSEPTTPDASVATGSTTPAPGAVWVPGTHLAIVPPDEFTEADSFVGFGHEASGSSIVVTELPAPFDELGPSIAEAEALATQGIELVGVEELTIGGHDAFLIEGIQTAQGVEVGKLLLVIGTDARTAILTGNHPIADVAIADAIRESYMTVFFDPDRDIE